ncbi:MAG: dihydroorotate dehydrogenase (quinone), partial [Verrucomicrobia bacterium]|nr:dihydroorotate dehydrogenase (quinone) [Verrucomicrobiota bacterium]
MLSWLYKYLARPVLFTQDPELVHCVTVKGLEWASRSSLVCGAIRSICGSPKLPVSLFGLDFPNPLGLAAGMDKNGVALRAWDSMGFGFSEIGAVTLYPQQGNPAPRVFRAIPEQAIVNR